MTGLVTSPCLKKVIYRQETWRRRFSHGCTTSSSSTQLSADRLESVSFAECTGAAKAPPIIVSYRIYGQGQIQRKYAPHCRLLSLCGDSSRRALLIFCQFLKLYLDPQTHQLLITNRNIACKIFPRMNQQQHSRCAVWTSVTHPFANTHTRARVTLRRRPKD